MLTHWMCRRAAPDGRLAALVAGARAHENMSMPNRPISVDSARLRAGFTLIEVLITLVIVAILAMVALPSFLEQIRKSRRSDAINAVATVQQAQERWRSSHSSYAGSISAAPTADPPGLGLSEDSTNGHYTLALSEVSATVYTITATATGSQASDTPCKKMAAKVDVGTLKYGSGSSSVDWADPNRCWAK